jgi:hypothetical protein
VNGPSDRAEQTMDSADRHLIAELGRLFQDGDPPPAEAMELARQSFLLLRLDAELAALVEDSDQATGDPAMQRSAVAVRGAGTAAQPRQLTFQFQDEQGRDELVIAVQVESSARHRRLIGHLAPQGPAEIEMHQPAVPGAHRVDVDHLGRFVIDDVLPGPMSLTCRRTGARPVATQWTTV